MPFPTPSDKMQEIYSILKKQFGLKESEIRILKSLHNGKKTARQISKQTNIPIGSIYDLLKELVSKKLIQQEKSPYYTYHIKNLSQNLSEFADRKLIETNNAKEELLKHVQEKGRKVMSYASYLEFKQGCVLHDPRPKKVYGLVTNYQFPLILFPEKNMLKVKKALAKEAGKVFSKNAMFMNTPNVRKYKELQKKCDDFKWIVQVGELKKYKKLLSRISMLTEVRDQLKKHKNTDIRVADEWKDHQFIVTNNTVQIQFRDSPIFIGLIIQDPKTVKAYSEIFMHKWKKSKRFTL